MRRNRRTKLIVTLGPASETDGVVKALFEAGADVFRINMSHSSHEVLHNRVAQLRRIEAEVGRPIGILADLQGPKLRVGTFAHPPVMLEKKQAIERLDEIMEPSDAVMVARGDLGVEMPLELVPGLQKRIGRRLGKPVVVHPCFLAAPPWAGRRPRSSALRPPAGASRSSRRYRGNADQVRTGG